MVLNYNYHQLPNKKGQNVKTPTIPVILKGRSVTSIEVRALIDSGADVSVIPKALAEFLDLDLSGETDKSYGLSGEVNVKNTKMEISLGKGHEQYTFKIPVQVILTGEEPPIILGRNGFFDKFIVSINEPNQKIKLKRVLSNSY